MYRTAICRISQSARLPGAETPHFAPGNQIIHAPGAKQATSAPGGKEKEKRTASSAGQFGGEADAGELEGVRPLVH